MNVTLRLFGLGRTLHRFTPLPQSRFAFSQYFEKADEKELSDSFKKHYRKDYLHYKLTDQWKKPLQRKQKRKQRKIQIAANKVAAKDEVQKLVVHNSSVGIEYPSKLAETFAVVQIDGFQYKIYEDALLILDIKKEHAINQKIIFDKVPLIATKTYTLLGRPNIQNAYVQAIVESISDSKKVIVFKKQRRKHYKRSFGSRLCLAQCRITNIVYELSEQILSKAIELQ